MFQDMLDIFLRESKETGKQRANYLFYESSLTWKIEEFTNQKQCLNWIARNFEFYYNNTGIEEASLFFYKKTFKELNAVEIASLIVSLKPLTRPKPTAKIIIRIRMQSSKSGMLESYPFEDISHILTPIGCALHMLINLAPLDNVSNICGIIKQFSHR